MVTLSGSYEFEAPQEVVWEAVQDPNVLSQVLPGCERLEETGENEYEGEIKIRVGPVQGTFQGTVRLSDIQAPTSYHIDLEGQGRPGYVKGGGDLRLEAEGDEKTVLHYSGEAQLSGRIASVGQRLMDSSARSITRQGLESLERQIQERLHPPDPAADEPDAESPSERPAPTPATPSTAQVGLTVARDVAEELTSEIRQSYGVRDFLIVSLGLWAIVWFWRMLFSE